MGEQQHSDEHRWRIGRDVIGTDASTIYMRRWFFWCPWFGIRVHQILRSDADRHLHDHPWDFASLLLTGGYTEIVLRDDVGPDTAQKLAAMGDVRLMAQRTWGRWSLVRHKAEDLHRLLLARPIWTLVFTGPKRKSWGFLTEDGMVPWHEYLARPRP